MIPEALIEKAKAKGTTEEYFKWLSYMPSAVTKLYGEYTDGVGRNDPAHFRTVEHGAGTGIKPPYSGIPLTHDEHMLQHQKGCSVIGDKDWWTKQSIKHLTMWINNVKPPEYEDATKRTFIFEGAGGFVGLWLWAKKYFAGNGKPLKVTVQETTLRSNRQNRGQWKPVYDSILEIYDKNPKKFGMDLATYCMKKSHDKDLIHDMMKVLCNYGESTRMGKEAHCAYFERIQNNFPDHEVRMPQTPEETYY